MSDSAGRRSMARCSPGTSGWVDFNQLGAGAHGHRTRHDRIAERNRVMAIACVLAEFGHLAVKDELSAVEQGDLIAHFLTAAHVVCRQQDGRVAFGFELQDHFADAWALMGSNPLSSSKINSRGSCSTERMNWIFWALPLLTSLTSLCHQPSTSGGQTNSAAARALLSCPVHATERSTRPALRPAWICRGRVLRAGSQCSADAPVSGFAEKEMEPPSGAMMPLSIRSVVLPAPLGPSNPKMPDCGTWKPTPANARCSPNRFSIPEMSRAGAVGMRAN